MSEIPSIDLHPAKVGGSNADLPIALARRFVQDALLKGTRAIRIITGLGIHGDGTPRLRSRLEREVLLPLATRIQSQHYEQGGAVIYLELESTPQAPSGKYLREQRRESALQDLIVRESRFQVAQERLEAATLYLDEGDLRRCRLKLNQILKEYFPQQAPFALDAEALAAGLRDIESRLGDLIQGS